MQDISSVFQCSYIMFFPHVGIQAALKALASIRKNKINSGDLVSILKNIGVALPKRIIEAALKNMSLSGEYLMFLITFASVT